MINITLNGEQTPLETAMSVTELLSHLGKQGQRVAVEINLEIIPRSAYDDTELKDDDRVEIVQAIGGG